MLHSDQFMDENDPTQSQNKPVYDEVLADDVPVVMSRIGFMLVDKHWRFPNSCSASWRIYFTRENGAYIDLADGSGRFNLTAGEVQIIPSGVLFDTGCQGVVPKLYIHFEPIALPGVFTREVLSQPFSFPVNAATDAVVEEVITEFKTRRPNELIVRLKCKALVCTALVQLIEKLTLIGNDVIARLIARHDPIAPALQHIDSHLRENFSNKELAAICHFSADHFTRKFKEEIGQTPAQYVQSRRIAVAAQRLVSTTETIERIAEQTGFQDRFHFSRVFVRKMGIGPATYRKRTAQQDNDKKRNGSD
jgi:AraC-like DNA-binding protein